MAESAASWYATRTMTTRTNRRVSVPSESATAKVVLHLFDDRADAWRVAPTHYTFTTDAKARAYADSHFAEGIRIRTSDSAVESVTRAG